VPFEFSTATRILFGPGMVSEVAPAAASMGRRPLLVSGIPSFSFEGLEVPTLAVDFEPTLDLVRRGLALARDERCDLVVSIGGGSAIDTGKAVAALLTNPGDPLNYLEVIGAGKTFAAPSAPFIAVPTTAGTGAEVTRNAVLASPEHHVKASLRSPFMLPRLAVIDPELTLGLPPSITASTGLDALTQLIEPYLSVRANPITDACAVEGLTRAARSLARAFHDGQDLDARTDMSLASLLGGLALANAGLGVVHGFAAPVGGMFDAPHGAICAALLPYGMETNLHALRERAPASETLQRFDAIARILTGRPEAAAEDGIEWVRRLSRELNIPPLSAYSIEPYHVDSLVELAASASSMKANPIPLSAAELHDLLTRAL
jgi:alcohol dehydrogenase class IV